MSVCYYGPDGQHEIFEDGTPCPKGWADRPFKVAKPVADALEVVSEALAAASAFDHDGDGRPGGSLPKAKRSVKGRRNGNRAQ